MSSPLNIHLEQYQGPLDLLLDLIRKQQIDIRDIPISTITSQYLSYMEQAREMDIDLSAEFVYMAATLIQIKSKMLLPRDPELEKESIDEDPRAELVERLLEHQRFKDAAEMLQQKRHIEENVWSHPRLEEFVNADEDPGLAVTLFDLVTAFGEILERARQRPTYEVKTEDVNLPDMIQFLRERLSVSKTNEPVFILQLFERQRSLRGMIVLFLAVLEMVKRQAVVITQKELFGEIALLRHEQFEQAFETDAPLEEVDKEYT